MATHRGKNSSGTDRAVVLPVHPDNVEDHQNQTKPIRVIGYYTYEAHTTLSKFKRGLYGQTQYPHIRPKQRRTRPCVGTVIQCSRVQVRLSNETLSEFPKSNLSLGTK